MVRENSNTTPYLTNETKDIYVNSLCGIIIIVISHFCGRLISFENSGNTTIRENISIHDSLFIIIIIENSYNTTVRENRSIIYNNITHKYTDES